MGGRNKKMWPFCSKCSFCGQSSKNHTWLKCFALKRMPAGFKMFLLLKSVKVTIDDGNTQSAKRKKYEADQCFYFFFSIKCLDALSSTSVSWVSKLFPSPQMHI